MRRFNRSYHLHFCKSLDRDFACLWQPRRPCYYKYIAPLSACFARYLMFAGVYIRFSLWPPDWCNKRPKFVRTKPGEVIGVGRRKTRSDEEIREEVAYIVSVTAYTFVTIYDTRLVLIISNATFYSLVQRADPARRYNSIRNRQEVTAVPWQKRFEKCQRERSTRTTFEVSDCGCDAFYRILSHPPTASISALNNFKRHDRCTRRNIVGRCRRGEDHRVPGKLCAVQADVTAIP